MTLEDFTTYTELDEAGDITVTSSKVSWDTMERNVTSYVYKDYGASYFGDFTHYFETLTTAYVTYGVAACWALANIVTEGRYIDLNATDSLRVIHNNDDAVYKLFLANAGSWIDITTLSSDTVYYCTVQRSGTTLTLWVYTDAEKTVLYDTLTCTCSTTLFEYIYSCMSYDMGEAGRSTTAYTENLDLNITVAVPLQRATIRGNIQFGPTP